MPTRSKPTRSVPTRAAVASGASTRGSATRAAATLVAEARVAPPSAQTATGSSALLRICQSWGLVATGKSNQTVVFKQEVGVKGTPRQGDGIRRPVAVPCSRIRPVTQENLDAIAATFFHDGQAVWAESIGCVVFVVTAASIGLTTRDEDVSFRTICQPELDGSASESDERSPRRLYYYLDGCRPRLPDTWIIDGKPIIPSNVELGVVDGMMRLTSIASNAIQLDIHAHVWVVPTQQLELKPSNVLVVEWLADLMTTVAKALNDAAKSHAKSGLAQVIGESAKHRTARVRQLESRRRIPPAKTDEEDCGTVSTVGSELPGLVQTQDQVADAAVSVNGRAGTTLQTWAQADPESEPREHLSRAWSPPVSIMRGFVLPGEQLGFARFAGVDVKTFPLTKYNIDLCFLSGTVRMSLQSGNLLHTCPNCWDERQACAEDTAATWPVELLAAREAEAHRSDTKELFLVSTSSSTLRPFKATLRKVISDVLGTQTERKSFSVYKSKRARTDAERATKAVAEAESQMITGELIQFAACCSVLRLDEHHRAMPGKSEIGGWEKVRSGAGDDTIQYAVKSAHSSFMHVPKKASNREQELYAQAASLGVRAAAAAWRVCICLLGLKSVQCVLQAGACEGSFPTDSPDDLWAWFKRNTWHKHPRASAFEKWGKNSGAAHGAAIRMLSEAEETRGMGSLDKNVCQIVSIALPSIRGILRDLLYTPMYDFDLWASDPSSGMRLERGRLGGDVFDLAIYKALNDASKSAVTGANLWSSLRMSTRIDRVLIAIKEQRGSTSVRDSLRKPVTIALGRLEKCLGSFIPYFLHSTGSMPILERDVAETLPERRCVIMAKEGSSPQRSLITKGRKRKGKAQSCWRNSKTARIGPSAVGVLSEAFSASARRIDPHAGEKALHRIATGIAVKLMADGIQEDASVRGVKLLVDRIFKEEIDMPSLAGEAGDGDCVVENADKILDVMVAEIDAGQGHRLGAGVGGDAQVRDAHDSSHRRRKETANASESVEKIAVGSRGSEKANVVRENGEEEEEEEGEEQEEEEEEEEETVEGEDSGIEEEE